MTSGPVESTNPAYEVHIMNKETDGVLPNVA